MLFYKRVPVAVRAAWQCFFDFYQDVSDQIRLRRLLCCQLTPIILLSYINTQLRDHYASLDALCADQDADKDAICAKLADVGYEYNASRNQFV